jgi:hypothetical protein
LEQFDTSATIAIPFLLKITQFTLVAFAGYLDNAQLAMSEAVLAIAGWRIRSGL